MKKVPFVSEITEAYIAAKRLANLRAVYLRFIVAQIRLLVELIGHKPIDAVHADDFAQLFGNTPKSLMLTRYNLYRDFFRFANSIHPLPTNPMNAIPRPCRPIPQKFLRLTAEDLSKILESLPTLELKLAALLLAHAGLRPSELAGLKVENFGQFVDSGFLLVDSTKSSPRMVPLTRTLFDCLRVMVEDRSFVFASVTNVPRLQRELRRLGYKTMLRRLRQSWIEYRYILTRNHYHTSAEAGLNVNMLTYKPFVTPSDDESAKAYFAVVPSCVLGGPDTGLSRAA